MRKLILVGASVYAAALVLMAAAIYQASPGPNSQTILGVGIGGHSEAGGIVYLSGRRLQCSPTTWDGASASSCRVQIAGKTLEILARRNLPGRMQSLDGACLAFYDGRQWGCDLGSRHVHVHWFAYIDDPLGLSPGQLAALRNRHIVENLPEEFFVAGLLALPPLTAALGALAAAAAGRSLKVPGPLRAALLAAGSGALAFSGTFWIWWRLTSGFWD